MIETLQRMLGRALAFVRSRSLDVEVEQELEHHVLLATDDYLRRGLAPQEARRRARLDLGGVLRAKEEHRHARAMPLLESARQDVAYAFRSFRRRPRFVAGAVVVLGLGIGVNTAVFSIVRPILLRPLPFADADQLVWISPSHKDGRSVGMFPAAAFEELRRRTGSFSHLSGYWAPFGYAPFALTDRGDAQALTGTMVAPDFFELLRVQPAAGRYFSPSEALPFGFGATAVVVSHRLWQQRFGGDPALIDKTVTFNFGPARVVGILPAEFDFGSVFAPGTTVDLFMPLPSQEAMTAWGSALAIVGRLKPGLSAANAQAEVDALVPQLRRDYPDWGPITAAVTDLNTHVNGRFRRSLGFLWGSVALVLLVACTNLSNLLLARAATQTKEMAVRVALGASRGRVVRQLLTESVVLALAGAAVSVPIAYALVGFVKANTALAVPLLDRMGIDGGALLFAAVAAVFTGLASMAVPAFRIAALQPAGLVRHQPGSAGTASPDAAIRTMLVISEVAFSCVLLVGAGLLARSFLNVIGVELGFQPVQAHRVRLNLADLHSIDQTARRVALLDEVTARVRALPGVQAVGITDALPLERNRGWAAGDAEQEYPPGRRPSAFVYVTGPGYLNAMGIRLTAGRDFSAEDAIDRRSVIVNERLARRLWPGQDPLGRPFVTSWPGTYTVVGVVADVRQAGLDEPSSVFQMYLPYTQVPIAAVDLIVRSTLPASTLAGAIRTAVGSIDSKLMASPLRPIEDLVNVAVSPRLFLMRLVAGFSLLALLLSSIGIYSVVAYTVTQRFHEIGVRMALGANRRQICRHAMNGILWATMIGIVLGTIAAAGLARLIATLLYNTSPVDPEVFAGVPLVVAAVALLSAYLPARRASRIDPMCALRSE